MISSISKGHLKCSAPSNIALVKYWGKYGDQLPSNPSISFTLKNSVTYMDIRYNKNNKGKSHHQFLFSGKKNKNFEKKIIDYLKNVENHLPFLREYSLIIDSYNTFPHSTGIASSASSMACLSFGLCLIEKYINDTSINIEGDIDDSLYQKASSLSRLGSGSACRSLYGGVVSWGEATLLDSTQEYASKVTGPDKIFDDFCDTILIVDSKEKSVSSRAGHALMNNHPFRNIRFENAKNNLSKILTAMKNGDLATFGELVESEALELHGLMMNSKPSFILMKPNTLIIIEKIREFRNNTQTPVYFTLDAGPNIHLLYPKKCFTSIQKFINDELEVFCEDNTYINDCIGNGPIYEFV